MPTLRKVMIVCTKTSRPVHTGLTLAEGEKLQGLGHRNFLCSECGHKHNMKRAFFESAAPTPPQE